MSNNNHLSHNSYLSLSSVFSIFFKSIKKDFTPRAPSHLWITSSCSHSSHKKNPSIYLSTSFRNLRTFMNTTTRIKPCRVKTNQRDNLLFPKGLTLRAILASGYFKNRCSKTIAPSSPIPIIDLILSYAATNSSSLLIMLLMLITISFSLFLSRVISSSKDEIIL